MAAVFALVFLFVLASGGLLLKVFLSDPSFTSIFAMVIFMTLAWGVFGGLYRMVKRMEDESPQH